MIIALTNVAWESDTGDEPGYFKFEFSESKPDPILTQIKDQGLTQMYESIQMQMLESTGETLVRLEANTTSSLPRLWATRKPSRERAPRFLRRSVSLSHG